jgi:hypothetical protein
MIPNETTAPAKAPGQVTFSAIADLHVAVDNAVHQAAAPRNRLGWAGIAVYTLLAYLAGLAALLSLDTPPRAGDLMKVPLAPAVVCLLAAWSRANWKARARKTGSELKTARDSSGSLAHETAAGLDAIRAHTIGLATAVPECASSAHFSQMGRGVDRVNAALRRFEQSQSG